MPTQLPRVPSLIPSSFATLAIGRDVSITIFTASSLNSGEKLFFGRGNYFTFPDAHPIGWTVRKARGTSDPQVVAFSSQPFWLSWHEDGRTRRHAPDYFARMADGTAAVIDVRADDQIPARDAEVFEVTARACASVDWSYRRAGVAGPGVAGQVRWLAGARPPPRPCPAPAGPLPGGVAPPPPPPAGGRGPRG